MEKKICQRNGSFPFDCLIWIYVTNIAEMKGEIVSLEHTTS